MATTRELETKISTYKWRGLVRLWEEIESRTTSGWESGKALEYLVLRAFQLEGAEIKWPYQVNLVGETIEQIDGVVYSNNLACLIECKDQSEEVNIEPVAKLRNQLLRRPGSTIGIVFSRSGFTDPAVTLARFLAPQTILLWDGTEIEYALKKHAFRRGLDAKYRYCVENGFPTYNLLEEDSL
jgi:hypothetical protein